MSLIFATILRRFEEGSRFVVVSEVDGGGVQCCTVLVLYIYIMLRLCFVNDKSLFCRNRT